MTTSLGEMMTFTYHMMLFQMLMAWHVIIIAMNYIGSTQKMEQIKQKVSFIEAHRMKMMNLLMK
jgi:hypothetical protein